MKSPPLLAFLTATLLGALVPLSAAEPPPAAAATDVFGDEILCRTRAFEIRRKELDRSVEQFKTNASLRNQAIDPKAQPELEATLLDRILSTRLLLEQATESDRRLGREQASQFVSNVTAQAGSDASFRRQLLALGFTREEFDSQVVERAICEEVIERELTPKAQISDAQVQAHYDANKDKLVRPEMLRARHILLSTRDPETQAELSDPRKAEKMALAEKILARAKQAEDFAALAKEFSEDPGSRDKGGELSPFPKGSMVPAFEAAAFALQTNAISGIVTTQFGYHIIQLLQRIPAELIQLEPIRNDIRTSLSTEYVQKTLLPDYLRKLKTQANVTYLNGARPPTEPTATAAPKQP